MPGNDNPWYSCSKNLMVHPALPAETISCLFQIAARDGCRNAKSLYGEGLVKAASSTLQMTPGLQVHGPGMVETSLIMMHYAWLLGIAFACLPAGQAVRWILTAQMLSGLLLGFVFIQSHNGMEVYSLQKDFFTAQIVSTRDIHSSAWNDWFTGTKSAPSFLEALSLSISVPRSQPIGSVCKLDYKGLSLDVISLLDGLR